MPSRRRPRRSSWKTSSARTSRGPRSRRPKRWRTPRNGTGATSWCPPSSAATERSMTNTGLTRLTAAAMSDRLRAGDLSSRELVEAHLALAARENPALNAWLVLDGAGARGAADDADARLAVSRNEGAAALASLHPLCGVPVGLKDLVSVRGGQCTAGSRILAGYVSPYDAHITERLRDAGAVILGKLNMDEFAVGPYAECSVDDPIANSSMFSLPRITAPASRRRSVMWASYGETYSARIREPAVHWPPRTDTRSLRPTGTPHSGCSDASAAAPSFRATASRASASSAASRAPARSRTSHALSAGFSRAARARCASTSSRDERSPARSRSLIAAAVRRVSPVFVMERSVAAEDGGHHDVAPVPFRGVRQRFGLRERGPRDVLAKDAFQLDRLGRRRDGIRVEPSQDRVLVEDVVQLAHEARQLLVGQAETGEVGDVLDLVAREGPHGDR